MQQLKSPAIIYNLGCFLGATWTDNNLMKHLAFLKDAVLLASILNMVCLTSYKPTTSPIEFFFSLLSYSVPHRHFEENFILLNQMIGSSWSMTVQLRWRMILLYLLSFDQAKTCACCGQVLGLNHSVRCSMKGVIPKAHPSKHIDREIVILGPNYDILKAWLSCIWIFYAST